MNKSKTDSFGQNIENFLRDSLYEIKGWEFIAGAKDGEVENYEFIENRFNCQYIEPGYDEYGILHGHRLLFEDAIFIMPDMLFKSKRDFYFWVESKASGNDSYSTIDVEVYKIRQYIEIQKRTTPVWIVFSIVNESKKTCKVFSVRLKDIEKEISKISDNEETSTINASYIKNHKYYKCAVYRFNTKGNIFNFLYELNY
jgi:hypothetical protein